MTLGQRCPLQLPLVDKNMIGPLESDEEKFSKYTFKILGPFSKFFYGALSQMGGQDKCKP